MYTPATKIIKNRAPRRWVQILKVSVWSRNMLLTHPRNEYIGGRWLCWRNSLSLSQSGRESNGMECHAQLAILLIFELIFFSRSGIEMGNKEGEGEGLSWSVVCSDSLGCLSGAWAFFEECCLRLPLDVGIVMGRSGMSDPEPVEVLQSKWVLWLSAKLITINTCFTRMICCHAHACTGHVMRSQAELSLK